MIDDLTYEALKGCYDVATSISAALLLLMIISIFLTIWLVFLLVKLQKERKKFKEEQEELFGKILEIRKKYGRKD